MSVNEDIVPLLVHDFKHQDVQRLSTWFDRFPDAYSLLSKGLREAPLKAALRDRMWVAAVFLLGHPAVSDKNEQIQQLADHEDLVFPLVIQANVHGRASAKFALLEQLHSSFRSA